MIGLAESINRLKNKPLFPSDRAILSAVNSHGEAVQLRPIPAASALLSDHELDRLVAWRNANLNSFLNDSVTDRARTSRWISQVYGPDWSRILFFVGHAEGNLFGHLGLCCMNESASYCELDNVIRGGKGPKGSMTASAMVLIHWSREELGLRHIWVRVLGDNPAISFYERLGFKFVRAERLRRRSVPGETSWIEASDAAGAATDDIPRPDRFLHYMKLDE